MVDVSTFEPYSKVLCPHCNEPIRVRRKFDHFMLTRQIGEGGMSYVFEAADETLARRVALKILNRHYSKDADRISQFEREARLTAAVTHANVVKLYSVGRDQGNFYIAMELVGGGSLEKRISEAGKLPEAEVLRVGRCIAEGLRSALREGLIHRDVKPANILFTEEDTPKIVDFGLALVHGRDVDESGEIWATPFYVAPEKLTDNAEDFRSDIYSLGATLYHALVGKPPYKADTNSIEELKKIKSRPVRLEDSGLRFAPRTCELINRMLALRPDRRYDSYDELVDAFRDAESFVNYSVIGERSRRQQLLYGALGILGSIVVIAAVLRPGPRPKQSVTTSDASTLTQAEDMGDSVEEGKRSIADVFIEARETLLSGDYKKARARFDSLITRKVVQPTLNKARFNAALCSIAQGKKKDAIAYFQDIKRDAAAGSEIGGRDQQEFFRKIGERMSDNLGLGFNHRQVDYEKDSEQVLGYLVHGLAQWHFGKPMLASEWLETFMSSPPVKNAPWIESYKTLIKPYLQDVAVARKLPEFRPISLKKSAATSDIPKTLEEARKTLSDATQTLTQLKTEGAYRDLLTAHIEALQVGIKEFQRGMQKTESDRLKELRQRELTQLNDMVSDLPALVHGYDFSHAAAFLKDIHFEAPEVQNAMVNKRYLWTNADEFMQQLIADVNTKHFAGAIPRRNGTPINGRITKMDYTKATIAMERGEVTVPTDTLPPEFLISMAQKFVEAITDSTDFYHRQEMIVVFAKLQGLDEMSNAVAEQLMQENRSFRQRWMHVAQTGS